MISLDYGRLRHVPEVPHALKGVSAALLALPHGQMISLLSRGRPLTLLRTLSDFENQGLIVRMRDDAMRQVRII